MNWYKTAKRSTGDAFAKDKLDVIFRKIIELDKSIYIKKEIEKEEIEIKPERIYIDSFYLTNNMQFGIKEIFVNIVAIKSINEIGIGGKTSLTNDAHISNKLFNKYINAFEIDLNIYIPYNFDYKQYNRLYYELSNVLRHEVEHAIAGTEKLLKNMVINNIDPLKNTYNYLTTIPEIEAFVTSFYMRAKKEKRNIKELFEQYIYDLLNSNNKDKRYTNTTIRIMANKILTIWIDYAKKRFPNLEKKYELV